MHSLTTVSTGVSQPHARPRFSVVVEGYNEDIELGSVANTVASLRTQTVSAACVEVILVGKALQAEQWRLEFAGESRFFAIRTIAADGAHYYQLKNLGARAAIGDIIVMADADVVAESGWLAGIEESMESGADFSAGLTRFYSPTGQSSLNWLLDIAASISWGFILGDKSGKWIEPLGFLSHNIAFRRQVLIDTLFPENYGRTCAGAMLYTRLLEQGVRGVINPRQRVAHAFSLGWWITRLHARFGYEMHQLRRINSPVVNCSARRLGVLEPPLTMGWHVLRDIPQWFRFAGALEWGPASRCAALPLLLAFSLLARGSEMIAMYQTIANPERMKAFAMRA